MNCLERRQSLVVFVARIFMFSYLYHFANIDGSAGMRQGAMRPTARDHHLKKKKMVVHRSYLPAPEFPLWFEDRESTLWS